MSVFFFNKTDAIVHLFIRMYKVCCIIIVQLLYVGEKKYFFNITCNLRYILRNNRLTRSLSLKCACLLFKYNNTNQ